MPSKQNYIPTAKKPQIATPNKNHIYVVKTTLSLTGSLCKVWGKSLFQRMWKSKSGWGTKTGPANGSVIQGSNQPVLVRFGKLPQYKASQFKASGSADEMHFWGQVIP